MHISLLKVKILSSLHPLSTTLGKRRMFKNNWHKILFNYKMKNLQEFNKSGWIKNIIMLLPITSFQFKNNRQEDFKESKNLRKEEIYTSLLKVKILSPSINVDIILFAIFSKNFRKKFGRIIGRRRIERRDRC